MAQLSMRPRSAAAATCALLACSAFALRFGSSSPRTFAVGGAAAGPAVAQLSTSRHGGAMENVVPAPETSPATAASARTWIASLGLLGAAAISVVRQRRTSSISAGNMPLAGAVPVQLVAPVGIAGEVPIVAMEGVKARPYIRIKDRTFKDWCRGRRKNTAAQVRFLIKPDGSIWRKQAGLRHLKSKKSPAHLKRLRRMVKMGRKTFSRLGALLGRLPRKQKAADLIMRKFNEARATKHLWTSDRGVGTALFC